MEDSVGKAWVRSDDKVTARTAGKRNEANMLGGIVDVANSTGNLVLKKQNNNGDAQSRRIEYEEKLENRTG